MEKKKNSPTIINDVKNYYNDLEDKRESLTSLHAVHLPTIAWTVQKRKQTRKQKRKQKHLVEHPAVPTHDTAAAVGHSKTMGKPAASSNIKIIIDDLPCMTTKLQLKKYFSQFGTISQCMSTKIEINAGCVVVLLNEKQQKYGESIHKKLDVNLQTQICYCDPKKVLGVVERVQNSGAKYCCVVGEKNQRNGTINFHDYTAGAGRKNTGYVNRILTKSAVFKLIKSSLKITSINHLPRAYKGPEYVSKSGAITFQEKSAVDRVMQHKKHRIDMFKIVVKRTNNEYGNNTSLASILTTTSATPSATTSVINHPPLKISPRERLVKSINDYLKEQEHGQSKMSDLGQVSFFSFPISTINCVAVLLF